MNFSTVILAGGQSRRMGSDKAFLSLDGKPLLARQVELVRQLGPREIFISGRAETDYRPLNCPVLQDRFAAAGPLAGIERALDAMPTPLLLVLAVDMPRMELAALRKLLAECAENCGVIPRIEQRIEPLAAIYPRNALGLLVSLLENRRYAARHFAESCVDQKLATFVDFPPPQACHFENWNAPLDVRPTAVQ